ncbi:MAG: L,D-transpeptidase [Actinomycetota bacterium]|nr:L,D-transpeptidase [Actinomycetota bacterium]
MFSFKGKRFFVITLTVSLAAFAAPGFASAANSGAPYGLQIGLPDSSAGGCLRLAWQVADSGKVSRFTVYRSTTAKSEFKSVFSSQSEMTGQGKMDFVDSGLEDGKTYFYRVATFDSTGKALGTTETKAFKLPVKRSAEVGSGPFKSIVISIADQRIYFLEDNVLVKSHLCSTGVDSHPTPTGVFKILYHEYLAISEKYGGVYCYWWMGFAPDTGMHALPYDPKTKTWTGASSLGHKASHGCVRQAVADAEWAYKWAPDGTRLDVIPQHYEGPPPTPPPITGGHASRGISEAANTWYLAEGCTSGNFNEYVLLMNPNPETANANIKFMRQDGATITRGAALPPLSRYTIHVDSIPELADADVSTFVESDKSIIAERAMYFDLGGRDGGSDSVGVSSPSETWYLAEGYTGDSFDEFILFENPQDVKTSAHVLFMLPGGKNLEQTVSINPHSRFTLHVDDIPGLASTDVSAKVTSTEPIVVERAMYFNHNGREDGNSSVGVTEKSKTWYLAEGYTGGLFDEYVLIENPEDKAGSAEVNFVCADGRSILRNYDLQPRSRFTIHLDDIPEISDADVSTIIKSDVDIVAERSMYFESNGRKGGSDSPGVTTPAQYWYMAEGYTGGDFDSFILILNPGENDTSVDVGFLLPGGHMNQMSVVIPAMTRFTIHVDDTPGMNDTEFSTVVHSTGPVICERAMYFSIPRN